MVARHAHELAVDVAVPAAGASGAMNRNGSNLRSYVLSNGLIAGALIELGYQDAMARRAELLEFLQPRQ